jgi:hypothetical protein
MASGTETWFDTIFGASPSLKSTSGSTAGQCVSVGGCNTTTDGGGGSFSWDSSTNTGDDGGTIIVPTGGTGRWLRVFTGPCDVRWFGAVLGAGKTSTVRKANKTALRKAVAAGIARGVAVLVPGILECEVESTDSVTVGAGTVVAGVVINGGLAIQGLGVDVSSLRWFPDAPTFDHFAMYIDAYATKANVEFRDLTVLGPPSAPTLAEPNNITLIKHQGDTRCSVVTAATNATPIQITTSAAHGRSTGDIVLLRNVRGANAAANGRFKITVVNSTQFTLQDPDSGANIAGNGAYLATAVTGATNATPIVITSTGHGRLTNDLVSIVGVGGNTAANGLRRVTVIDANSFTLSDPLTGDSIAGNGAYTSGGTVCDGGTVEPDHDYVSFVDVRFDGKCTWGFVSNEGNTWTTFTRTRGRAYRGFGGYYTGAQTDKRLTLIDSDFYGAGYATPVIAGVTAYPWYVHPSVSLLVDACRFHDSNRYALHIYGSPTQVPQYCVIQNSLFDADCVYGVLTNALTTTKITGCSFLNNGIQYQNEIVVEHCDIVGTIYPLAGVKGRHFKIAHTQLRPAAAGFGGIWAGTAISATVDNSNWIIDSCDFRAAVGVQSAAANTLLVSNCVASLVWSTGGPAFVQMSPYASTAVIRDNVVLSGYLVYIAKGPISVELRNNRALDPTYGRVYMTNVSGGAVDNGVLSGADNYFGNSGMFLEDATSWQRLGFRHAQASSSLASGTTLTLPGLNADTYRVTGTATITNLYVTDAWVTQKCSGKISLIADGSFTLGSGGNIIAAGGARAVNSVIELLLDSSKPTPTWYEV